MMMVNKLNFKTLYFFIALATSAKVSAQQLPVFSQYYFQPVLLNPAMIGEKDYAQAFLLFREQWVGIPGAPSTQLFNIDGYINDKMALAMNFYNDRMHIFGRTGLGMTYKYNLMLNDKSNLHFGLNAGLGYNRLFFNEIDVQNPEDNVILSNTDVNVTPEFNVGIYYRYEALKVGLVANNLAEQNPSFSNQPEFKALDMQLLRHYQLHASYVFDINADWQLEPIVVARAHHGGDAQFDFGAYANWQQQFWGGLMYRSNSSANVIAGVNIAKQFAIGYTYELPIGDISTFTSGSHEFVLNYNFVKVGQGKYSAKSLERKLAKLEEEKALMQEQIDQLTAAQNNATKQQEAASREELKALNTEIAQLKESLQSGFVPADSSATYTPPSMQALAQELLQTKQELNKQQSAINELKAEQEATRDELEQLKSKKGLTANTGKATSNNANANEAFEENDPSAYFVVLGAYKNLNSAKRYQNLLKTQGQLNTGLKFDAESGFYFVGYGADSKSQALQEIEKPFGEDLMINGKPWVYVEE